MKLSKSVKIPLYITVAFTVILSIAGCATVGKPFDTKKVLTLESGVTTQEQVLQQIGQPWRKGLENGKLTWTYAYYRYSAFSPLKSDDLVIKFKLDGTVETYTFNTSEDIPKP